jgi:Tfp pilus assembly protein PilW
MRGFRNHLHCERGFTIVETLITAVLTLMVAGAAMEFYVTQHKTWMTEGEVAEIQYNVRASLDEIARALRMGGYQLRNHPAFAIGSDSLVIYYRDETTAEVDTLTYFVAADNSSQYNLYKQPKGESPAVLAENVEAFALTKLGPNLIDISLTARALQSDSTLIHGDGYRRRTIGTQVRLRNTFEE